ncbi:MAG TPA: hypothetical protein VK781_05990 [Solirubrobacteraceae bacterium]|jgi:hypothetical protein|nr:hypothetical protein [Solirubrobacteraceae bacterium]
MRAVAGADEAGETRSQAPEQKPGEPEQATEPAAEQTTQTPGFGERGRMRRRARFLRKARELAYRDLGGLVFDLHRFGQRNDQLVLAKLAALRHVDTELRELEGVLRDRRPVTVLREVGIAACPRCAAIHGSDDRFCPGCGLAFDRNADRPISTSPLAPPAQIPPLASQPHGTPAQIASAQPPASDPGVATPAALTAGPSATAATPSPTAQLASPASASPPSTTPAPPKAPPAQPKVPPFAAKPAPTPFSPAPPEPDSSGEDEPTQVLRPPARGT